MLKDNMLDRITRERNSHTKSNDVLSESYRLKDRFGHIWSYPSRRRFSKILLSFISKLNGNKILDYGCGKGNLSQYILSQGGVVYGIDISSNYIKEAVENCSSQGYNASNFHFYEMDAHIMNFPDNFFDIVVGLGILHHLDSRTDS